MAFNVFLTPTTTLSFGDCAIGQRAFRNVEVLVTKNDEDPQTTITVSISIVQSAGAALTVMNDGPGGWQGTGPFTCVLTFTGNQAETTLPLLYQVPVGGGADVGVPIPAFVRATTVPAGTTDLLICSVTPVDPIERAVAVELVLDCTASMGAAGLQSVKDACARVLPLAAATNLLTDKDWLGVNTLTRTSGSGRRRIADLHMCSAAHVSAVVTAVNALTLDPSDANGDGIPDEGLDNRLVNTVRSSQTTLNGICDCAPDVGRRAVIVVTDGGEAPTTARIAAAYKVAPIGVPGLGAPNMAMLNWIARGATPLALAAAPTSGSEAAFLLDKYLIQVLASLFDTSIALDPDGIAPPEDSVSIPFWITGGDREVHALLLTDDADGIEVELLAPDSTTPQGNDGPERRRGVIADGGPLVQETDVDVRHGAHSPRAINFRSHRAAARVRGKGYTALAFNRAKHAGDPQQQELTSRNGQWSLRIRSKGEALERSQGVPKNKYSVVVLTRSELKFNAELSQDGCYVGAMAYLSAQVLEAGGPVHPPRARVYAEVQFPDGGSGLVRMKFVYGSRYEGEFRLTQAGPYRVRINADGHTLNGERFHREMNAFGSVEPRVCEPAREDARPVQPDKPCGCK